MVSQYVTSSDGAQIYCEAYGNASKPALVVVAGYTLSLIVFVEKQLELQKDLHLVLYDMRGHRRSAMPETIEGHASKLYVDDFEAVCDAFKLRKPVFGGWSLGGTNITDICDHLGADILGGIILIGGIPFISALLPGLSDRSDVKKTRQTTVGFNNALFLDPESVSYFTRLAWMGCFLPQPPEAGRTVATRTPHEAKIFAAGKTGLKVMCLYGEQDAATRGMAVVEVLRPHFPHLKVVGVDQAGHSVFYEKPVEMNKALLDFVRACDPSVAPDRSACTAQ